MPAQPGPLLASAIKASKGLTLLSTSTDPNNQAVTVTVINGSNVALQAAGSW